MVVALVVIDLGWSGAIVYDIVPLDKTIFTSEVIAFRTSIVQVECKTVETTQALRDDLSFRCHISRDGLHTQTQNKL